MEEVKPIKRSKELAPLSREHHEGLLFGWKIKQGLANHTGIELMAEYTLWFWKNHLMQHFRSEEEILIKHLPADNPLVLQMKTEHEQIKELVKNLGNNPGAEVLKLLAETIHNHIRFEERQLFPYAEKKLTREQLNEIFDHLPQVVQCDTEWKNEFWVKK